MTPEIEQQIKDLEIALQVELASTPDERVHKRATKHSIIRQKYARKITNLRKYGAESTLSLKDNIERRRATMQARYGAGTNVEN